ncbi:MAG: enoyl-CoA hydratase/isomerase family protein [Aquihabitans sp.]
MIQLDRDGDVYVLRMESGENRFSPDFLSEVNDSLSTVEVAEGPKALVTTGAWKFFSNGLDLDWLNANATEALPYLDAVHRLFARVLQMPCATVAACNGHTFGAGAMLAMSHDFTVMRRDRGYWCLPEVDLGMTFTPAMNAMVPGLLPSRAAHEAMVTARRYTAEEALSAGIVDAVADEPDVVPEAIARAQALAGKAGKAIGTIRTELHAPVIAALTGDHP